MSRSYIGGPLGGLSVTNGYDRYLRRANLSLLSSGYGYDAGSRLRSVSDGSGNSATYIYLANSPLVSQISFTNGTARRMVTTKQYDLLNRLLSSSSSPSSSSSISFSYLYNAANQRTAVTNADTSYWRYLYDNLGQVISGKKFWSDNTPVAGQQFEYTFDDIGNRQTTASGGDNSGGSLRTAYYAANSLNQYTSRNFPGYVWMFGTANSSATVTLWGSDGSYAPTVRKGQYFEGELWLNNVGGAFYTTITNLAVLNNGSNPDIVTNNAGNVFVAKTPEGFGYDGDGNLTSDGRWTYTWDAENRLVSMQAQSTIPTGAKLTLDFTYDWQGRRIQKTVSVWNGSAYVPQTTNRFVYDAWNLVAILNPQSSILDSFVWGLDLSGSMQGAGGVGGLLMVYDSANGVHFAGYDGNGNVAALVKAVDGTVSAQYEYGPFGEVIRATGPMARVNPCRFSTKCQDDETDLVYYGYRYYNSTTGRWLNRDPIEEQGGLMLYGFIGDDAINSTDLVGRGKTWDPKDPSTWGMLDGVWVSGKPGNGRLMPSLASGYADLGTIEYRNGLPIFSTHAAAAIDGQVHVVILEEWKGTKSDQEKAKRVLKEALAKEGGQYPEGRYVWHHEEIVMVNGKEGVRMVLVPERLNRMVHNGPASWRRAALSIGQKAGRVLKSLGRCLTVLGVASFAFDPGGAIAAPLGGETTAGDATIDGAIQRAVEQRIQELQGIRDPKQYRARLLELRSLYQESYWLKHLIPLIDQQMKILDSVPAPLPP